jgi:protein-export chaperone SecB
MAKDKTQDAGQPQFSIQRIYLKDLSFETPQGPSAFKKKWQPKVSQDLNTKTNPVEDDLYEVALRVTITVADGEETIYVVEAEQAGLFNVSGFAEEQSLRFSIQHVREYCSPIFAKHLIMWLLKAHSLHYYFRPSILMLFMLMHCNNLLKKRKALNTNHLSNAQKTRLIGGFFIAS